MIVRMSALNAVVSALADPKRKEGHIPYRNSKLTRILQVRRNVKICLCCFLITTAVAKRDSSNFIHINFNSMKGKDTRVYPF